MRKIKLMIDKISFKTKPTVESTMKIQNRLKNDNAIKEVTIEELSECIKKGFTIVPAVAPGGARNENWKQQEIIFLDIDNNEDTNIITPDEAILLLEEKNIPVLGYYETFSSTEDKPKFRLIILLDKPITEVSKIQFMVNTLIDFIPQADKACKNQARIFYGTNGAEKKVIIVNANATITLDDVIKLHKPSTILDDTKEDDLKQWVKEFDLEDYMKKQNKVSHSSSDTVYFEDCSICGHQGCLRYYPKTNSFFCFGANGNIGGNIIDYLMATKNMDKAEAIKHFKYEIKKLPKPIAPIPYAGENYSVLIKNQVEKLDLDINIPIEVDWIQCTLNKDGTLKWKVLCPRLAKYISDNIHYIFARNKAKSGTLKYFYFDNHYKLLDDDEIKGFIKHLIQPIDAHKTSDFNEVLNLLSTEVRNHVLIDDLNSDENIINFKNGILNLNTGELEPHSPNYLSTIQIPFNYIKDCPIPINRYFDNYMYDYTNGDAGVKKFLLQNMGIAISNVHGYRMKQALFCVGPGNTGKSILKLLLTTILGIENCSSVDLKDLEKSFHTIQLLNKRLAGSNDMGSMKIASLEKFKQLTGGDYITDSYKNEGHIDFRFNGLIWLCGNDLPVFGGDKGDHVYERMNIVECNNIIPEDKRDKKLLEHLLEEGEYIISLLIPHLQQVIKNGYKYNIPDSCKKVNAIYKVENNSFLKFMNECTVDRIPNEIIKDNCTKGAIFKVYKAYCKDNNKGYFETKGEVKKLLEKLGKYNITKTNNGNEYYDFILNEETIKEYSDVFTFYDDYYPSSKVSMPDCYKDSGNNNPFGL